MATDHNFKVKNGLTVQGETLVVNHTGDLSGTQVYIKYKDSSTNLMRWGEGTSGASTYRFRIDQNFRFIGNSGSGDNIVLDSADGSIQGTSYQIGGTTVISSSRNLTNINNLTATHIHANAGTNYEGLQVSGSNSGYTSASIRNTGSGDAVLYFDASNGDLSGSDYAWIKQSNALNLVLETSGNAGNIQFNPRGTTALKLNTDQSALFSGEVQIDSGADQILTLNQATTGWNYIGFESGGTRKFYLGNDGSDGFVLGSDVANKTFSFSQISELSGVPLITNTSDISIKPAAGQDVLLFNAHNSESQLRLYNNRQDVSNTPVSSIVSYNSTQVSKIQFYRGTGGSSGYINFQVKPQNGESLTDTFQIGDNNTVGYGVNVRAGGYRVGGTTVIDSSRNLRNVPVIYGNGGSTAIELNHATYTMLSNPEGSRCLYLGDSGDAGNYYDNDTHYFRTAAATVITTINSSLTDLQNNLKIRGTQGFNATGETASIYLGDNNSEIRATYNGGTKFFLNGTDRMEIEGTTGNLNLKTGNFEINGTTVIDSSRNLTNIGTISSGAITSSSNIQLGSGYNLTWGGAYNSGNPTIAANSNTLYFYPTGNVSGQRLYLNATSLVNAGSLISTNYVRTTTGGIYGKMSDEWQTDNALRGGNFSADIGNDTTVLKLFPASPNDESSNARAAGDYSTGIAFMHLDPDNSGWGTAYTGAQAWVGLKVESTPGQEFSSFVIATNASSTAGTMPVERFKIDKTGAATFTSTINSGAIDVTGNSIIRGSGSSGNAFNVNRGSDSTSALRVLNTGEVLVASNYFYVNATAGAYIQNTLRVRGTITNDTGTDLRLDDDVRVTGNLDVDGIIDATRNNGNVAAPSTSDHTAGTRIKFYDTSATAFYAIGIEGNTMWFNSDVNYKWYQDAVSRMELNQANLNLVSGGYQIGGTTVIDSSRNITAGTITGQTGTFTGLNGTALTVNSGTTNVAANFVSSDDEVWINLKDNNSGTYGALLGHADDALFKVADNSVNVRMLLSAAGLLDTDGGYSVGGTTVINSSRNLSNIGTISSGAITSSGDITTTADLYLNGGRAIFDTDTGTQPFQLNRIGIGTTHNQSLKMWVDDSYAVYVSEQDEANRYGGHVFRSKHGSTAYTRLQVTAGSTSEVLMYNNTGTATWQWNGDNGRQGINKTGPAYTLDVNGTINGTNLRIGTTEVIDSSRNLFNVNLKKFRDHAASPYISPSNPNTLNAQHGTTADTADMWINYRGYNDTFSNFRDFRIGDGKGTALVFVDGSEKKFEFQNGTYLDSSSADLRVNTPLNIATAAYEGLIVFGTADAWHSGIRQHDDGDAELRIWHKHATRGRIHIATAYDGEPATLTRPTNGLMVYGANGDVAIGDFSANTPAVGAKLHVKSTSDYQLRLDGGGTTWAGINFLDSGGNDNLWYFGATDTWSFGGSGSSNDSNKRLHVHGGMTVGNGYAATASGANNLRVENYIETGSHLAVPANSNYNKIRLYGHDTDYAIGMASGQTYGGLGDWAMTFKFSNENDRGFKWMDAAHGASTGAMALTTNGKLTVAHSLRLGYGESDTTTPGAAYVLDVAGAAQTTGRFYGIGGLLRSNSRISTGQIAPIGHYSEGDQVFGLDTTWTDAELQSYFNSTNVSWSAQADAPGGYAVYINGGVNVGGVYNSGFPYIPVDQDDVFYMECWIKNAGTGQTHYMGSNEFNESFGSLGGNPGSYGYWVMSNTNPGSSWTKVTGYIRGFHVSTVGFFENGTKYWTPMALFNYGAGSGTRACYISGWKVIRVSHQGERTFDDDMTINSRLILNNTVTNTLTLNGNGAGISFSGGNNRIFFGGYRAMEGATNGSNLQIGETYSLISLQASNTTLKSGAKLYFNGTTNYGIGAGGHNLNSGYFDTLESGSSTDPLELVYYQGPGVNIGSSGSKYLGVNEIRFDANTTNRKINSTASFYSGHAGVRIYGNWNEFECMGRVLDVSSSNCHFMDGYGSTNHASHYLRIGSGGGGNGGLNHVHIGCDLNVAGNVTAYYSDARLKQNVETIPNALEILKGIRAVTFEWNELAESVWAKKQGDKDFGMIAQEVEAVFPMGAIVQGNADKNKELGYADPESPNYDPLHNGELDEPEYKTVKYDKMVALAIQAIKEQDEKIQKLEELVEKLISEK